MRTQVVIGRAVVASLYVGIFLRDAITYTVGGLLPAAALGAGLILGVLYYLLRNVQRGAMSGSDLALSFLAVIGIAVAFITAGQIVVVSYMFSIVCALILVNSDAAFFLRLLALHCIGSIGIQVWEYIQGDYLFVVVAADGSELDTKLFGGAYGITRTKGLFQGPLSAVAFAFWIAFLYGRSIWSALALLITAYLASGRLGMLIGAMIVLWRLRGRASSVWPVIGALVVTTILAGHLLMGNDAERAEFIALALDLESGNNIWRLIYWVESVNEYLNYDVIERLIGRFGHIRQTDISPENDFLLLLLNHGVFGFLIYLAALCRLAWVSVRRRDSEGLFAVAIIILIMNVFPFVQSLFSATLFWFYVLAYQRRQLPHPRPTNPVVSSRDNCADT